MSQEKQVVHLKIDKRSLKALEQMNENLGKIVDLLNSKTDNQDIKEVKEQLKLTFDVLTKVLEDSFVTKTNY